MAVFQDQLGNSILLDKTPKRIISLVPSITELLFDLGLDEEIIGITDFCIHPKEKISGKKKIGGTKKLNIEKIVSLQPDLIIGNKEENEKQQIEELQKHFPVWVSDIKELDEALAMIHETGKITGREQKAVEINNKIEKEFHSLSNETSGARKRTILYFIWKKPFMVAGKNTFIDHLLQLCSLENLANQSRYPEMDAGQIKKPDPEFIFLSSEPFPFSEKHIAEFKTICPNSAIVLVDGEMFSWYGSRLQHSPSYFRKLLAKLY